MAPTIFSQIFRIIYFIKNPQTTIALTFLTHIISTIGGVVPVIALISEVFPAFVYPITATEGILFRTLLDLNSAL